MKFFVMRHPEIDFKPICYALGFVFFALQPAQAVDVTLITIDGTQASGDWLGASEDGYIQIKTGEQTIKFPMYDVARVRFDHVKKVDASHKDEKVIFHLADGGRLIGLFVGGGEESVLCDSVLGEKLSLPFDRLAGIQLVDRQNFSRAYELFVEALSERLPGKDTLITRSDDDAKSLRGRLTRVDPVQCSFMLGDHTRNVQTEKLFGLVFATGVSNLQNDRLRISLADGSNMTGQCVRADQDNIVLNLSIGKTLEIPIKHLASLDYNSERVVYIGDIDYAEYQSRGRLHRSWPVRLNQNVAGGKISIGGQSFTKGIGCHSYSEIKYNLDGKYESFVSTIGIDDVVRPRGCVVFRVLGDDQKVLYESDLLRGTDAPRNIIVDVQRQKEMTLVVDFGDELDLSDYSDWAAARLIKPVSALSSGGL